MTPRRNAKGITVNRCSLLLLTSVLAVAPESGCCGVNEPDLSAALDVGGKLAEEIMSRKPGVPVMPVETQPSGFKRLVVRYWTLMPRQ